MDMGSANSLQLWKCLWKMSEMSGNVSQVLPSVLMQPASVQTLGTRVPMSLHLCRDAVVPDKVKKLVLKGCFLF